MKKIGLLSILLSVYAPPIGGNKDIARLYSGIPEYIETLNKK